MKRPREGRRVPTRLKVLRGTARKDRTNPREPKPELATPEPPAWLNADALAEWKRLVPELEALRILTRVDRDDLAAYCDALAEWKEATEDLAANGSLYVETPQGFLQAHPAVSIRRNAREAVRKFSALYGLNPADRSKIHAIPEEETDPLAEFTSPKAG